MERTQEIAYSTDELQRLKEFNLNNARLNSLMEVLEVIKDCEMSTFSLEAKVIAKIDSIIDEI
jgi:hypothetical protein